MQIFAKSIDDFKSDRKGISPPLPAYLRIVPLLFYLGIIATIMLNGIFFLRLSQASQTLAAAVKRDREIQAQLEGARTQRKNLEGEAKKASDIVAWVEGARPLQPLVVEIARSIGPEASIVELRLDRDGTNPAQVLLSMRLQTDATRQLDLTLARITGQRFRTFSPQQTLAKGEIDYKVTLLWQDTERKRDAEQPVAEQ